MDRFSRGTEGGERGPDIDRGSAEEGDPRGVGLLRRGTRERRGETIAADIDAVELIEHDVVETQEIGEIDRRRTARTKRRAQKHPGDRLRCGDDHGAPGRDLPSAELAGAQAPDVQVGLLDAKALALIGGPQHDARARIAGRRGNEVLEDRACEVLCEAPGRHDEQDALAALDHGALKGIALARPGGRGAHAHARLVVENDRLKS